MQQPLSTQDIISLADQLSLWKMEYLTRLGRLMLPEGYWGLDSRTAASQARVFLTFDDGPHPSTTPRLLEMLAGQNVRASFFLIGRQVARHEELVAQIFQAGHLICNHSLNHHFLPLLSTTRLEKEIDVTNQLICDITGLSPQLFRPPYGIMSSRAADCLKERQMIPVYWSCVPEDWEQPGVAAVANRVLRKLEDGALVVLHERKSLGQQTVEAAKQIICKGKELGYEFSNLPESELPLTG